MKKILITGSNGFIGKALKRGLIEQGHFNILEYNRDNTEEELKKFIDISNIIIHLAGEVRPNSHDNEFTSSNVELTEKIASYIKCSNFKNKKVLFSSSIHCEKPKNLYGVTKLKAEECLIQLSKEIDLSLSIFRLPHLFGPGAKPFHNSAITTWIVETQEGNDINIYDPTISINYCYILDVVESMINEIHADEYYSLKYIKPEPIYPTTLGEVALALKDFYKLGKAPKNEQEANGFIDKLYKTYISYLS